MLKEEVVGVVICDVENKNEVREEPVGIFPEKFMKLERFFGDMKSNIDLFEEVGIDEDQCTEWMINISKYNFQRDTILDIFIVCSRSSYRGQGIAGQLGLFKYSQICFDNDLYFIRRSSGGG